jgi:hypothetical protein
MGKQLALVCVLALSVPACTSSSGDDVAYVKGFNPPPVKDGYTRYVLPPILGLHPGEDKLFCQWVQVASPTDVDIVDVEGYQSVTGHHEVLYSSSEVEAVGTSRECTTQDMISVEFLGGIGGEGGANASKLPDGYVFRQRKERTLLVNAHYLNATDSIQDVQSVMDVKIADPSPERKPVGMAVINYLDFQIPPNTPSYSVDATCTWPQDTNMIMWSNHMHANGLSISSDFSHAGGAPQTLATDASWQPEASFNPTWTHWDVNSPLTIHAGDTTHIKCTWQNNTSNMMLFPDEMCDAVGFYTDSSAQQICDAKATSGT